MSTIDEYFPGPYEAGEGVPVDPPEIVEPNPVDPGNVPSAPDAVPPAAYHEYQLDLADTAAVYLPGSIVDTGTVLQYIVDRGYAVVSVDAQLDAEGLPTGVLTVRTPLLAPDIVVAIAKAETESGSSSATTLTYIPATAIEEIPIGFTYSGDLVFAAEMRRDQASGTIAIEPMVDGVAQPQESLPADITFILLEKTITVAALASGARTFGLKYVVGTSGIVSYIQNGSITGTLTSDQPAGEEIPPAEWAEYTGTRSQEIVQTIVPWADTAEGTPYLEPPGGNTTNLVQNPRFASSTGTGWAYQNVTASLDAAAGAPHGTSVKLVNQASALGMFTPLSNASPQRLPVTVGLAYTLSWHMKALQTGRKGFAAIIWRTSGDVNVSVITSAQFDLSSDWQRFSVSGTAPATAAYAYVVIHTDGTGWQVGDTYWVTDVQFEQKASATPYADGSLGPGHAWTGTAHASTSTRTSVTINPVPDEDRIQAFWMYLEASGHQLQQIEGDWNFSTPDQAPASPELRVYARGAIDPAVSGAFLYSSINPQDRDAFRTHWIAAHQFSRMERVVNLQLNVEEYEYSTGYIHAGLDEPTDDVRDGDIWIVDPFLAYYFRRINGEWVEGLFADGNPMVNENSLALGRRAVASDVFTTAVGVNAEATDHGATAVGNTSVASANGSLAVGQQAEASGVSSTAIGQLTSSTHLNSTAIGQQAAATNSNTNAIGTGAAASGAAANALGRASVASGTGAIAIGNQSLADKIGAIGVGNLAQATGINALVAGSNAAASAESTLAVGLNALASAFGAMSLGAESDASGIASVALGHLAQALADYSIAIGYETEIPSTSPRSWGIGYSLTVPDSLPDTGTMKANRVRVVRSDGTGQTELMLRSADGTDAVIHAGDDDRLFVNGGAQIQASVMTTRGDLITQSSGGVPARLARGAAYQVLAVEPGGQFLQWQTRMRLIFYGQVSVNPPSINANTDGNVTVAGITGALAGDKVTVNPPQALAAGLIINGCRAGTDSVVIYFRNVTAAAIDQAALNWSITVERG